MLSTLTAVRDRLTTGPTGRVLKALACLASSAIAVAFLAHIYGAGHTVAAAKTAHIHTLLGAIGVGVLIQVVRALRSRWLLAQHGPVSLPHSFAAMVVGHGIGDLVPVAPGGPVLRSLLTERLAGVPVAFSGGAYMVEGTLDVIVPALLVPYLLLTLALPSWTRWVLLGIGAQATLFIAGLILLALRPPISMGKWLPRFVSPRLAGLAAQVAAGLRAVTAGGLRRCLLVCGLSLLLLPLTAFQTILFLHAFALSGALSGVLLLLVVMLSAGSLPFKIPAFGTISAAAALPIAGIQGPAVGGYLLVSQLLLSSQTVMLALVVLSWWLVRGIRPAGRYAAAGPHLRRSLGDVLALGTPKQMSPAYAEVWQDGGLQQP